MIWNLPLPTLEELYAKFSLLGFGIFFFFYRNSGRRVMLMYLLLLPAFRTAAPLPACVSKQQKAADRHRSMLPMT